MNTIGASGEILKVYHTGDRPILILCSDGYHYICKYKQPGCSANKLVNELIGSFFSKLWGITTPQVSLVSNDPIIWEDSGISHDPVAPLFGSRKMENVIDLSSYNFDQISITEKAFSQLLKIALFDLWIANEDRTCNNYNLLYDLRFQNIVSIDYGGIFNSGIMGMPIYQLNENDSILSSDLFDRLKSVEYQYTYITFLGFVSKCKRATPKVLGLVPKEWGIDIQLFADKLKELFDAKWLMDTWETYKTLLNKA